MRQIWHKSRAFLGAAIIATSLATSFVGCQLYQEALRNDERTELYMSATRKAEILNQLRTEAVILATNLNIVSPERFPPNDGAVFLIDIFIAQDSNDPDKRGLFNPVYALWLDGAPPQKITRLSRDELIAQNVPYVSPWGEYFLVSFERPYMSTMQLEVERKGLERATLRFAPSKTEESLKKL